ncbi:MAG: RDD family protein [Lysobacteraceae bacterium]
MLDTTFRAATPEGVELAIRPAGPTPRALAWLIDLLWRMGLLMVLMITLLYFGRAGVGVFLIAWFVLEWLVPACLEAWWDGATPGKRALGIRVIAEDGAPAGFAAALARNLLRFADFLPFGYVGGLLTMLCNPRFQRLGDLVAGTLVVHVDAPVSHRLVARREAQPPRRPLTAEEARSVVDLAERSRELGPQRTDELLALAAPMLGERADEVGLQRIAGHLLGVTEPTRAPG